LGVLGDAEVGGLSVPNSFGRAVKICKQEEVQVWNSIIAKCPRAGEL